METASGPQEWKPAHQIDGRQQYEAHCPVCAAPMTSDAYHQILRCTHCRTESKVERRLVREGPVGGLALEELSRKWELQAGDAPQRTRTLVEKIISEKDLRKRLDLAQKLEEWQYINPTLASLLPQLIATMRIPAMEIPIGNALCMLLCEGDKALRNAVLRAAEPFVFDHTGPPELLFSLGLGSGVCLKLLLDAANHAADAGALEYACTALWGINLIFERNYPERNLMGEIILYRLLYMRGPVQAWALELAKGQMGLGYRYPTPTLLRFMDDCFYERPELLPEIEKCFYNGSAATEAEYRERLDFIDQLLTKPAKSAALRQIYAPPDDSSQEFLTEVLTRLLVHTKDKDLEPAACEAIGQIIQMANHPPQAVEDMIQTHRDTLPEEVRRAYLRRVDKSPHLTPLPPQYWQPTREKEELGLEKQLDDWRNMWKEGLNKAVDAREARKEAHRNGRKGLENQFLA
jgi:hypothetical protein